MSEYDTSSFGSVLRYFRRQRLMTQQQLAKKLECHVNSISLWEREELVGPESHNVLLKIAEILALNEEDKRLLIEARYGTASILPLYNLPLQQNPYFTGRASLLQQLHELLMLKKQTAIKQAISGLGGVGKTQLAIEYAYRFREHYHDILWVAAESRETFMESYLALAGYLRLREQKEREQRKVVDGVKRWLREHKGWLLILDNIENLGLLREFVPTPQQGVIILTTRLGETSPVAETLIVDILSEEEATLFLLRRAGYIPREATLETASAGDRAVALTLVRAVGGLPLALDQAGAYVAETKRSLSDYLDLFEQRRMALLDRRGTLAHDHPLSVVATFSLAFEQVQQKNEVAIDLLKLCAYIVPDAIPLEVITEGATHLGTRLEPAARDALQLDQALETLQAYSLVQRDGRGHTLSIHRLVQAVLKDMMDASTAHLWAERAVNAVNAAFPDLDFTSWTKCERCLPHALICARWIAQEQIVTPEAVRLLNQAGAYLHEHARYAEAEPLYQQVLVIYNQCMTSDPPDKATILNNLASAYEARGFYTEAEPVFKQALAICEQQLGPEHPCTAMVCHNLAHLYENQDRYSDAEPLYQRALVICEQQLGPKHSEIVQCLNGLAGLYRKLVKYLAAEPLYRRALAICEQQLGPEHPCTAMVCHNLAHLYEEQSRYSEAELFCQRALAINELHLGPEHRSTVNCLVSLANLYWRQGRYAEARPLCERALTMNEQHLGPDHPSTAVSLNSMAALYERQDQYEDAEVLYQRALAIRKQFVGLNHPDTALSLNNLAHLYYIQGRYTEAESMFKQALAIREQVLGLEHPLVVSTLNNLASLYLTQEKHGEAEALYQRGLHIQEQLPEAQHPDAAPLLLNLAALYFMQGRYEEAEPLFKRALQILEQVWGPAHPNVASVLNDVIRLYSEHGKYAEAELLYQRALHVWEQVLGPEHSLIASTLNDLAVLYAHQGDHAKAKPLFQRALQICEQTLGLEEALTQGIAGNYAHLLRTTGQETEVLSLEARFPLLRSEV